MTDGPRKHGAAGQADFSVVERAEELPVGLIILAFYPVLAIVALRASIEIADVAGAVESQGMSFRN